MSPEVKPIKSLGVRRGSIHVNTIALSFANISGCATYVLSNALSASITSAKSALFSALITGSGETHGGNVLLIVDIPKMSKKIIFFILFLLFFDSFIKQYKKIARIILTIIIYSNFLKKLILVHRPSFFLEENH